MCVSMCTLCVRVCLCVCVCTCVNAYECMTACVFMCVRAYVCVCVSTCVSVCVWTLGAKEHAKDSWMKVGRKDGSAVLLSHTQIQRPTTNLATRHLQ